MAGWCESIWIGVIEFCICVGDATTRTGSLNDVFGGTASVIIAAANEVDARLLIYTRLSVSKIASSFDIYRSVTAARSPCRICRIF